MRDQRRSYPRARPLDIGEVDPSRPGVCRLATMYSPGVAPPAPAEGWMRFWRIRFPPPWRTGAGGVVPGDDPGRVPGGRVAAGRIAAQERAATPTGRRQHPALSTSPELDQGAIHAGSAASSEFVLSVSRNSRRRSGHDRLGALGFGDAASPPTIRSSPSAAPRFGDADSSMRCEDSEASPMSRGVGGHLLRLIEPQFEVHATLQVEAPLERDAAHGDIGHPPSTLIRSVRLRGMRAMIDPPPGWRSRSCDYESNSTSSLGAPLGRSKSRALRPRRHARVLHHAPAGAGAPPHQ